MDARDVSLFAIFAGLYGALNVIQTSLGGPITYGPIQLRLADCLIPLSALFGWPQILGLSIGCLSNAYYWLDPADVIVGSVVNFLAAAIFGLRKRRFLASVCGALIVGIPIGLYLYYLYTQENPIIVGQVPSFPGLSLPVWAAFAASLTASSLITVASTGYIILRAIAQPAIIDPLRSRGLKVYT